MKLMAMTNLTDLTANIKMKLVENHILTNAFNRNINQNSVEIGQWLTQAKALVKHGQFSAWLDDNFQMTDRTARNYMKVAAYFGVNSPLKTENVFRFQPAALIELTKIPAADIQNFLSQAAAGVDLAKLSVRNLRDLIKNFLTREKSPVIEPNNQLQLFDLPRLPAIPKPYWLVPDPLLDAATRAGLNIQLDFSAKVKIPADCVLITKEAQIFLLTADVLIFCPPFMFKLSNGKSSRLKFCLWYSGAMEDSFIANFKSFGVLLFYKNINRPDYHRSG